MNGTPQIFAHRGARAVAPENTLPAFEAALEMGFFVAFGGLVFRTGEGASADVARIVPLDRLLTETDSPYLKPRNVRGSRNQPLNVAVTATWLRRLRGDEAAPFGQALVENFDLLVGATPPSG